MDRSVTVEVEVGAAAVLNPLGFTRDSVAVGDVVTIVGNPARSKPDQLMLGRELYKQDGAYYPLNIASRSVYAGRNEIATTIAGTWFSPRTEFNGFLGGVSKWPVTDKGKAAMASCGSQVHDAEGLCSCWSPGPDVLPRGHDDYRST